MATFGSERPGPGEPAVAAWAVGSTFPADLGHPPQAPVLSRGQEAAQTGGGVMGRAGSGGEWEVAWVCAADCVARAKQALSGPQYPLWGNTMDGPGSPQGEAQQLQLPGASVPCLVKTWQNLGVRRTGFPPKPLYSLTVPKGARVRETDPTLAKFSAAQG